MKRFLTSAVLGLVGVTVVAAMAFAGGRGHGPHRHHGRFHHPGHGWRPSCLVPVTPSCPASPESEPVVQMQTRRFLQVTNETGENLTVCVQYRTVTDQNNWRWYPADPSASAEALVYELAPGATAYLEDEGWQIRASRVRIWAVAASGQAWMQYRGEDLWLVPETHNGIQCYPAPEMETFPFTFPAVEGR